jgi:hypothetical protein
MAILNSKSGASYDTETGKKTSATGVVSYQDPKAGNDTAISSTDLQPQGNTNLPPAPVYDNSNVQSGINNFTAKNTVDSEAESIRLKSQKDAEGVSQLYKDIGVISGQQGQFMEEAGGYEAKKQYDEYTSQMEAEQLRLRRETENIRANNPNRGFGGALNQQLQDMERKSLSKQADIAILGNAAGRRYDTALSIAKDKVEMLMAPKKAELEGLKYIQENNKAFQTAEFSNLLARKTAEFNKELENKEKAETMIVNALQGKAPQGLIDQARKIIEKGGTSTEVANVLGNYSMSSADRLDLKLKQAQLDKIYSDIGAESAADKKARLALESEKKAKLPQLQAKLDLIEKIKNNPAIKATVGTTVFSRGGIFGTSLDNIKNVITGDKQALISAVNQLTNKEFLDAITALKAQGGTLGDLSEREGQKLSEAATQIGTWEIKDKNGRVTGYNIDEENFNAELDKIFNATDSIFTELGGLRPGSQAEQDAINNYLNAIDDTLLNSDNLYSEAGYN